MTQTQSFPHLAARRPAVSPDPRPQATCPLCHTRHARLAPQEDDAGDDWQCARCGQRWDALRLQTVADYTVWDEGRGSEARTGRSHDTMRLALGADAMPPHDPTALRDAISAWDDEGGVPSGGRRERTTAECDDR